MPLTATFPRRFTAVFTPPKFGTQISGPPLLTEADTVIQTESGLDISVEDLSGMVTMLTAHRVGLNRFIVSDILST